VRSIIKEGGPIRMDNFHKANHDVISTKMIESIQVNFADLEQVGDQLLHDVEVRVKERPRKHVELEAKWQVKSGYRARVEKLVPHVSLSFEHHNLGGHATQVLAKMATPDLTNNSDLDFELVISKPYYLGIADPKKTTLDLAAFNKKDSSSVFISKPDVESDPVFIDRTGIKASLKESYSHRSKGSLSMTIESVSCVDSEGNLCAYPKSPGKTLSNAPPTTISNSGSDSVVSVQGDIVVDDTTFKRGCLIGARDIFTVNQGIGFSFFNCFTASMTRFTPIPMPQNLKRKLPISLVLHGKVGNSIGDVASYNYFTLGGPFSCRGFDTGELGSSRRFIEIAAEARYPINIINGQIFSFLEHTNSLSAGQDSIGDPNLFYRRGGKGSSWGYGVKMGALRFEFAQDCNLQKGSWFVRFGERF